MPAGDAQRRPGNLHARADHVAIVDGIAECHVAVTLGAHISYRGESSEQGDAGVLGAGQSHSWNRYAEGIVARVVGSRQMRVHINKTRQDRGIAKVDLPSTRG